jgi:hypothetical protein
VSGFAVGFDRKELAMTRYRMAYSKLMAAVIMACPACVIADEGWDGERLAVADSELSALGDQVRASVPAESAQQPSVAWIRTSLSSLGNAVVGYTADGVAAWAVSQNWSSTTPIWTAHKWNEPGVTWPDPANLCDVYNCAGPVPWTSYDSVAKVLGTGLTSQVALVALGGAEGFSNSDIAIVSSKNGGASFGESKLITVDTPQGDSGGNVDPDSVHAALLEAPERTNDLAGTVPLNIYVIWRNTDLLGKTHWWATKVLFGLDGTFIQQQPPKIVKPIPDLAAGHASINASIWDDGTEGVAIAWSQRKTQGGMPSPGPACPSTELLDVEWRVSSTVDFDPQTPIWECPETLPGQCLNQGALISKDKSWKPCVGASFSSLPGAPPYNVNNDRPEYVINRGAPHWFLYLAINRSVPGQEGMRTVVFRDSLLPPATWQQVYESPGVSATGAPLGDASGHTMTLHQGVSGMAAIPAVSWRTSNAEGLVSMQVATSAEWATPGHGSPASLRVAPTFHGKQPIAWAFTRGWA